MVSEYDTMHICLSNQLKWAKVGFSYCSTVLRIHQRCLFRQNSQCINCTDKYNEKHYRKSDLHVNQSVSLVICSNRKYFERETERDRERERERETFGENFGEKNIFPWNVVSGGKGKLNQGGKQEIELSEGNGIVFWMVFFG